MPFTVDLPLVIETFHTNQYNSLESIDHEGLLGLNTQHTTH